MTQNIEKVTITSKINSLNFTSDPNAPYMIPVLIYNDTNENKECYKEITSIVQCKNYIAEMMFATQLDYARINVKPRSKDNYPDYRGGHPLAIIYRFNSNNTAMNVIKQLNILTELEDRVNIPHTKIMWTDCEGTNSPRSLLVIADKAWSHSNLMASIHIQLIRILTFETNSTSFEDHLRTLITRMDSGGIVIARDIRYFKALVDNNIDLVDLISNMDKVVSENTRYSGWDDKKLTDFNYDDYIRNNHSYPHQLEIDREVDELPKENGILKIKSRKISTSWDGSTHDNLGIYFFCQLVSHLKEWPERRAQRGDYDWFFNRCGSVWAYNYLKLIKSRNETQLTIAA